MRKWQNPVSLSRRTYVSWAGMRHRCYNPKNIAYKFYGGLGITVCDKWRDNYDAFVADMGFRPEGTEIERKNNKGNYEPSNCRWATRKEQTRNTRRNRYLEWEGKFQVLEDWAIELGISPNALKGRLDRGLNGPDLFQPGSRHRPAEHGSRAKYNSGCRCEGCSLAQRLHDRQRKLKRKQAWRA